MKNKTLLYVIFVLSVVFIPAAYVLLAAVFVVWILKWAAGKQTLQRDTVIWELLPVTALTVWGTLMSSDLIVSLIYAGTIIMSMWSYRLAWNADWDDDEFHKLIYWTSAAVFVIGIGQFLNPDFVIPSKWVDAKEYELSKRIYATFFNPNAFGFYIAAVILSLSVRMNGIHAGVMEIVTFTTGMICLTLTFSRTAWVSLLATLVVAGFIFDRKFLKWGAVSLIFIVSVNLTLSTGRLNPIKAAEDSSVWYRFEIWKACFDMIRDFPLTGVGLGAFFRQITSYTQTVSPYVEHCHSIYLQVFVETGIFGGACALSVVWIMAGRLRKILRRKPWDETAITFFLVMVMISLHGLVDSVLFTPQIMIVFSLWGGYAAGRMSISADHMAASDFKVLIHKVSGFGMHITKKRLIK